MKTAQFLIANCKSQIANCIALTAACFSLLSQAAPAADLPTSWTALPDETVVMLRLPAGEAFVDALRKQTKLGAVVLGEQRLERLTQIIREQAGDDLDKMREALGRVDLKLDDWHGVFHGDLGIAVTLEPRPDRAPLVVLLGWLEPGEELAPRLLTALQSVIADEADEPFGAKRKDIELAGHEVMQLDIPVSGISTPQLPDLDDDDDNSDQKVQQEIDKFKERLKEAKTVETDRVHFFVSRLGGRIVWGSTVPQSGSAVQKKSDAEREAIDWDALTGTELATTVFGRFLSAHGGSSSGGVQRLLETPGLEPSLPGGTPLVELVADPRPLLKLIDLVDDAGTRQQVKKLLESLGAEGIGPLALRVALDGTTLRTGAFVSMPAPRPGLLALYDQAKLDPEPPAWVPTRAIGYQQSSLDLGAAYTRIKALVIEMSGDQGRQTFDQLESTAKLFLQVDVADVLSSLGDQYSVVTFEPRTTGAAAGEGQPAGANVVQRVGVVWKVKNEQVLKQFLKAGSQMLQGSAGAALKSVEELGVSGYRFERNGVEVSVFVGNGWAVLGIGPEVSETLLVALRTPPEGNDALRTSGLVERGRALIAPQPCTSYNLSDAGASIKLTRQNLQWLLEAAITGNAPGLATGAPSEQQKALLEKLKTLLPSEDEMQGVMGVKVGQTVVTDDGLSMQSAVELPAP